MTPCAIADVDQIRAQLLVGLNHQSQLARFLENHDEPRCVDVFGKQRLPSVATLMGTLPGMRFYYQDQLQGCEPHLPITLRIQANRPPDRILLPSFSPKSSAKPDEEIFHEGEWRLLQTSAGRRRHLRQPDCLRMAVAESLESHRRKSARHPFARTGAAGRIDCQRCGLHFL